ncbi:MAG TPA: DUF309 domain-containing protein [Verrucomicrobiae bacterium]|nr:DUF309 domain-containing protein [Verrucomicrobiae bacterium]
MSRKSQRVASLIGSVDAGPFDPHYLGYFDCFNRQLFFEAHEVLEELWLGERGQPRDLFYKGLIQLAGAFVHVQKDRRQPALALLNLSRKSLASFPSRFEGLDLDRVRQLIEVWTDRLGADSLPGQYFPPSQWPTLMLPWGSSQPPTTH